RLDLADLLVEQDLVVLLAVDDGLPGLTHAVRAERIGFARPAERRLHLLPRLLQRELGPVRGERGIRLDAVQGVERDPGALGDQSQALLYVLNRLVHKCKPIAKLLQTKDVSVNWTFRGANGPE